MELYVKIILIIIILGGITTGITFAILCMNNSKKSEYQYPIQKKHVPKIEPQQEEYIPTLISGSPHTGPIAGPTQQPNCGVIWDNIDVNYDLPPIDPSLGPVSPEYRAE